MDVFNVLLTLVGLLVIMGTIYVANQAEHSETSLKLLNSLWVLLIVANATFGGLLFISIGSLAESAEPPSGLALFSPAQVSFLLIALVISGVALSIVRSPNLRMRLRQWLPSGAQYDPQSPVHTTAIILSLLLISMTLGQFVASGGIDGLATDIQTAGVSLSGVFLTFALWVIAAVLGVGLFIRRTVGTSINRLGVRLPTPQDLNWGIGIGFLMVGVTIAFTLIWVTFTSPELFAEQTAASAQLARSFVTVPSALILSLLVGFSEELFFRGALQPIFGNIVTSVFFLILHTQYTLSPATIPLFMTSLAFGWLRNRYSTSAAMTAHFVFNFTQLFMNILVSG